MFSVSLLYFSFTADSTDRTLDCLLQDLLLDLLTQNHLMKLLRLYLCRLNNARASGNSSEPVSDVLL